MNYDKSYGNNNEYIARIGGMHDFNDVIIV